jgi:Uncharacterized protein conserved in bacteria
MRDAERAKGEAGLTAITIRTESLGGSPLSRAARAGALGDWYRAAPRGTAWRTYADEVRSSVPARWYEDLEPAFAAAGEAADRLRRSGGGAGIVVTTGQQPGLFGGPLYSLIKALSARALADQLQADLGIPVAPVFWAATDDADFAEASVVSVGLEGGAEELRLPARGDTGMPMSATPMPAADVGPLVAQLRAASGSAAHEHYLNDAIRCYREGGTVGGAYVALLRGLLEPLGIAVIDASHPAVAAAARGTLLGAAHGAESIAAAVRRRSDAIVAAGFEPQVDEVEGLSLVFTQDASGKRRLPIREAIAAHADTPLSPTVLLRPVVERSILPTAAYLGGPGEIAYFAQVSAVAEALDVPVPLVLPRWSATIVEPRIQRILDEFQITAEDLADPNGADTRVARHRMPAATESALRDLHTDVSAAVDALQRSNGGLVNDAVVEGLRHSLEHRLARVERRFIAAVKRREADAMRRIATARGSLFPHGVRQERKLSYIPFLARYGQPLVEQMLAGATTHARALIAGAPAMSAAAPSAPASV